MDAELLLTSWLRRIAEAAWAQLEARDPFRDRDHDWIRQAVLRKQIIDNAGTGRIEFDTLYEKVLGDMPTAP